MNSLFSQPVARRTIWFLSVLLAVVLAWNLRSFALVTLPVDYDEDDYLRAAQEYAAVFRSGDLTRLTQFNYRPEHPPLSKIIYGLSILPAPQTSILPDRPTTASPDQTLPKDQLRNARTVGAILGTLTALLVALLNPLAGFFLAIHSWTIKYTSQVMLEALPALTSLLAVLAYRKSAPRNSISSLKYPWLALSALFLGLTAASKYIYCLVGIAILIDWFLQNRPTRRLVNWLAIFFWGFVSLLVFLFSDPYLWPNPLARLADSVFYHARYSTGAAEVASANFPLWQPLNWLGMSVPWNQQAFRVLLDPFITLLATFGLSRLWKKERIYVLWLATAILFLLAWPTKWPQYILVLTVPLSLAAAEGAIALLEKIRFSVSSSASPFPPLSTSASPFPPLSTSAAPSAPLSSSASPPAPLSSSASPSAPLSTSASPLHPLSSSASPPAPLSSSASPSAPLSSSAAPSAPLSSSASPSALLSSSASPPAPLSSSASPFPPLSTSASPLHPLSTSASPLHPLSSSASPSAPLSTSASPLHPLSKSLPWLLPGLLAFLILTIFPLLFQVGMSFTSLNAQSLRDGLQGGLARELWGGLTGQIPAAGPNASPNQVHFIGLHGYALVFDYITSIGLPVFTILWTALSVFLQCVLGLGAALLLWNRRVALRKTWQVLFILPWAIPEAIGALMWLNIFAPVSGWLSLAVKDFGAQNVPFSFLVGWERNPNQTLFVLLLASLWYGFPFLMLAASAGLKMLPTEVFDAAAIDGATPWQTFRHVTWPLLMPLLVPAIIIRAIFAFNQFYLFQMFVQFFGEQQYIPVTLSTFSYYLLYRGSEFGVSAILNIITVLMLIGFVILFNRWSKAGEGLTYA